MSECDCLLVGRPMEPVERARWVMPKHGIVLRADSWTRGDAISSRVVHLTFGLHCDPLLRQEVRTWAEQMGF